MKRTTPSKYQGLSEIQKLLVRIYLAQMKGQSNKAKLLDRKLARLQRMKIQEYKKSHEWKT